MLQYSRYLWHPGEKLELMETQPEEIVAANDQLAIASQGYCLIWVATR